MWENHHLRKTKEANCLTTWCIPDLFHLCIIWRIVVWLMNSSSQSPDQKRVLLGGPYRQMVGLLEQVICIIEKLVWEAGSFILQCKNHKGDKIMWGSWLSANKWWWNPSMHWINFLKKLAWHSCASYTVDKYEAAKPRPEWTTAIGTAWGLDGGWIQNRFLIGFQFSS